MGDPKVQRSDGGFFTRLGRAIDALGGDVPPAKSDPRQKRAVAVHPLPAKYAARRRLDRSVVSMPDPTVDKIGQNEEYVANALRLVMDMRALAVKEDSWFNRTTPKDVDKVTNKYQPLLLAASGATPLEKSEVRRKLAEMMIKELFETSTGENLFWDFESNSLYQCTSRPVASKESLTHMTCNVLTVDGLREGEYSVFTDCSSGEEITCTIAGKTKSITKVDCTTREVGRPFRCD